MSARAVCTSGTDFSIVTESIALHVSALKAPMNGENVLYLNGDRDGIVNNCCFTVIFKALFNQTINNLLLINRLWWLIWLL